MIQEYKDRLNNLKDIMHRQRIDIVILNCYIDIYYFSGTNQLSTLVIPVEDDPVLFVQVGFDRAETESWITDIRRTTGADNITDYLKDKKVDRAGIGINEDTIPVFLYKKYIKQFPQATFMNISPFVLKVRLIKSEKEIALIEKSAQVSFQAHNSVPEILKENMTELALAAKVEYVLRKNGHLGTTFSRRSGYSMPYGVIGPSGPNLGDISGGGFITNTGRGLNSALPVGPSMRSIQKGELIEVDIGTNVTGYHSDEARMYVLGRADEKQTRAFDIVFNAYEAALSVIRPGVKGKEVYHAAREVIEKAGYLEYFAGFSKYPMYNFLGHGVGLEINEAPLINGKDETVFQPNMVIALEPKLVAPDWGVTFEDTLVVTETGYRLITRSKRELIAV